jgi:hypothetical protein
VKKFMFELVEAKEEKEKEEEEKEATINRGPAYNVGHSSQFFSKSKMNYTISDYSIMQECRVDCYFNSTIFIAVLLLILVFVTNICCLLKHWKKTKEKKVGITHTLLLLLLLYC